MRIQIKSDESKSSCSIASEDRLVAGVVCGREDREVGVGYKGVTSPKEKKG
jgi:hypothetical protein